MFENPEISEIRKQFGPLFSAKIKGQTVLFRELTFSEFDKIVEKQRIEESSSVDSEDEIISVAVVYPVNFDVNRMPAGLVSGLAEEILNVSGFNSPRIAKSILEEKRESASSVRSLMKAFVLATISSYKPEELDALTYSQLAEKVALAEKIIEITQSMHGVQSNNMRLELIDPEEEQEKEKQASAKHDMAKNPGAAGLHDPIAQKLWGGR